MTEIDRDSANMGHLSPNLSLPTYAACLAETVGQQWLTRALDHMRAPDEIMNTNALKLVKASSLSFARGLVDRMIREKWKIALRHSDVEADGSGLIVYAVKANDHDLTFAARAMPLADIERSGRIKDNELDFYATLFDGVVDLRRIRAEADEQVRNVWKGRTNNDALGWTFANRSNRLFKLTVAALARGEQPIMQELIEGGGYLVRNAGFYGNGRHGCRSFASLDENHPLIEPYHMDLFCLYLWRQAGFDFIERIARARNPEAVILEDRTKRYLGVGNSSGIGMVAALVRWPQWVNAFCFARELALALALTDPRPTNMRLNRLRDLLARTTRYYQESETAVAAELEDRKAIAAELEQAQMLLASGVSQQDQCKPGDENALFSFMRSARERFGANTCEQLVSLIIDTDGDMARELRAVISSAMRFRRDVKPEMRLQCVLRKIEKEYAWALDIDRSATGARHYFWYRSEENGENRRGERDFDPGVPFETFIDVSGHVQDLHQRISASPPDWNVARYLVEYPEDVYVVSRVQSVDDLPYAEIRTNLVDRGFLPSDLLQFFLAILGMETTNPNNFRWVKGVFLQGAPLPSDLLDGEHGDWTLPAALGAKHSVGVPI